MIYFRKEDIKIMGFYNDEIELHKETIENDKYNFIAIDEKTHQKLYKDGMYKLKIELDGENQETLIIEQFEEYFETYKLNEFGEMENKDKSIMIINQK